MGHLDNLIRLRIYTILGVITETFQDYLKTPPYKEIDVEFQHYIINLLDERLNKKQ